MKPIEILSSLPALAAATPAAILDSPAFAMPCRYGDEPATLRPAAVRPADTRALAVLGDAPHTLSIAHSPRFPELDTLWDSRADVPAPILLALAEKECGPLFQLLENAVRRQLRLKDLSAPVDPDPAALALEIAGISFTLTRSPLIETALGASLRHLDLSNPAIRGIALPAETEYAAFSLSSADQATLAPGDTLLLPEIGTVAPRLLVDTRFGLDASGVTPFTDDSRCRVIAAEPATLPLGTLFDAPKAPLPVLLPPPPSPPPSASSSPAKPSPPAASTPSAPTPPFSSKPFPPHNHPTIKPSN